MPSVTAPSPEFVDLCKSLYGGLADADALWAEVSKMSPDPSSVHIAGSNMVLRPTRRRKAEVGKIGVPVKALVKARVGQMVSMAERLDNKVLGSVESKASGRRQLQSGKQAYAAGAKTPPVAPGVPGAPNGAFTPKTNTAGISAGQTAAMADAGKARNGVDRVLSTKTGKIAVGGGGLALYSQGRKSGKRSAYASVDPYAKRAPVDDVQWGGTFSKFDDDKRLAFGWASVVKVNGEHVIDRQGDYIGISDIEDAAYVYVEKSRVGGDMHRRTTGKDLAGEDSPHHVADLVESMVFTPEKIEKMGLPRDFPIGWWVGFKVHDDEAWSEVKKGNRTGFSIHGKGIRKDVDYDSIMAGA